MDSEYKVVLTIVALVTLVICSSVAGCAYNTTQWKQTAIECIHTGGTWLENSSNKCLRDPSAVQTALIAKATN